MNILYEDNRIIVAVKPSGIRSTDEPGGMPSLLREYLGDSKACVRSVHRLDQTVSGVMVYARSRVAASLLSEEIREHRFKKEYFAVIHGSLSEEKGRLTDNLFRDKATRTTRVVTEEFKGVQNAVLNYQVLASSEGLSLLKISLETGRTHQIRVQLSSRGVPIVGDRKYGISDDSEHIALYSCRLSFSHPQSGDMIEFLSVPEHIWPWSAFPQTAYY